jgi:hypothetical protein
MNSPDTGNRRNIDNKLSTNQNASLNISTGDALIQILQTYDAWLQKKKERIYAIADRALAVMLVIFGWIVLAGKDKIDGENISCALIVIISLAGVYSITSIVVHSVSYYKKSKIANDVYSFFVSGDVPKEIKNSKYPGFSKSDSLGRAFWNALAIALLGLASIVFICLLLYNNKSI